jgi:hypothetical protein
VIFLGGEQLYLFCAHTLKNIFCSYNINFLKKKGVFWKNMSLTYNVFQTAKELNCGGLDAESCIKGRQEVINLEPYNLNASAFVSPLVTFQLKPYGWVQREAELKAAALTANLAAQAQGTILAGATQQQDGLSQQAHNACFVQKDAETCSQLNYVLAAREALSGGPNGSWTEALNNKRRQGSIDNWFVAPVPYTTVKPVAGSVAAVAGSVGKLAEGGVHTVRC